MSKESEEATSILKYCIEQMKIPDAKKQCIVNIKDLEIVLQALENSIDKEIIETLIKKLQDEIDLYDYEREQNVSTEISFDEYNNKLAQKEILQDLLEGE